MKLPCYSCIMPVRLTFNLAKGRFETTLKLRFVIFPWHGYRSWIWLTNVGWNIDSYAQFFSHVSYTCFWTSVRRVNSLILVPTLVWTAFSTQHSHFPRLTRSSLLARMETFDPIEMTLIRNMSFLLPICSDNRTSSWWTHGLNQPSKHLRHLGIRHVRTHSSYFFRKIFSLVSASSQVRDRMCVERAWPLVPYGQPIPVVDAS